MVPKVISFIFDEIAKRSEMVEIQLKTSYLELYNEQIIDLLDPNFQPNSLTIREERDGSISIPNLTEEAI
jgi:hypothetical protein